MRVVIIFFIVAFCVINCKAQSRLPKNLDEAIAYFQKNWTKKELEEFKNKPESDAIAELHFGTGQWIRNHWVYGDRDTALTHYFNSLGIYHPDDISSIILQSLHRRLNGRDLLLQKTIDGYKAAWKVVFDCKEKQIKTAVGNYEKFEVGDTVSIYMPVDTAYGSRNAVIYDCPTVDWTFDAANDLLIRGTIVRKHSINDKANVFFKVHIISMSRNDVEILMEKVKPGDNEEFSLIGLRIK